MKHILIIALLLSSTNAFAASAFWTGRQEQVQTTTYQLVWNCEYNYNGYTFWRMFRTYCQSSVEVE